ncbi:MAG: 6-bladed beta-propeller [Nitrospiria bacterium]
MYVLIFLALSACAGTPVREDPAIFWPKPPDPPRISYIQTWVKPADIGVEPSWFKKVIRFIFGEGKTPYIIRPSGIAVDIEGGVYVADTGLQVVHFFDTNRRKYKQFFNINRNLRLQNPIGVALDNASQLYVSDADLNRIFVFDPSGKSVRVIGNDDEIKRVSGIAIDRHRERLYVVDTMAHQVHIYSLQGQKEGSIGKRGVAAGTFNFPTFATVDKAGNLYVSDSLNFRIQIFDPDGTPTAQLGSLGDSLGEFSRPKGVAVDRENNIYVVDTLYDTVQIFNRSGELLLNFGTSGMEPGHFWLPSGIAVDPRGRIYVADGYNKRVQVFQLLEEGAPSG